MKIAVISSGSWGTALAITLCNNGHQVSLWSRSSKYTEEMQKHGENTRYLPGFKLPKSLELSSNISAVLDQCELIVTATPTQFIRNTFKMIKEHNCSAPICNVSKGIEVSSLK